MYDPELLAQASILILLSGGGEKYGVKPNIIEELLNELKVDYNINKFVDNCLDKCVFGQLQAIFTKRALYELGEKYVEGKRLKRGGNE